MSWRPRLTDWLLVVGMVLLLVGAPSYFAASDARKALEEHGPVSIRGLHVGDRADFALLMETPDGATRSPAVLRFEVLDGSDATDGAAFVLRWTHHAVLLETAGISYAPGASVAEIHLDATGAPVWYGFERPAPSRDAQIPGEVTVRDRHSWGFRELQGPSLLVGAPERFIYRPDTVERVVGGLERGLDVSVSDLGASAATDVRRAFVAAEFDERLLLGTTLRAFTPQTAPVPARDGVPYHGDLPNITLDHPLPTTMMLQVAPMDWTETVAWTWYTPDLGAVGGFHQEWRSADGVRLLAVDLVPIDIVAGTRPVPQVGERAGVASGPPKTIALGDLQDSPHPLHQNLSLAEVYEVLKSPEAPQETQTFLRNGGYIVEYSFDRDNGIARAAAAEKFPGLVPSLSTRDVVLGHWRITLADAQGTILPVQIEVREILAVKEHQFTITSGCTGDASSGFSRPDCSARDPAETSPGRRVVPPEDVLTRMGRTGDGDGEPQAGPFSFHYLPLLRVASDGRIIDPIYRFPMNWQDEAIAGLGWGAVPPGAGVALERHGGPDRTYMDIETGSLVYEQHVVEERTTPDEPASAAVMVASAGPEIVTGLDAQLLLSGLALVLLSVLLRTVLWSTAGGLWKLFGLFFSRLAPGRALAHPTRAEIIALVHADPGMTIKEIKDVLGLAWGTVVHHLRTLESTGHLKSMSEGRMRHFFIQGTGRNDMLQVIARRQSVYADFLGVVLARPGIGLDVITETLGRQRASVSRTGTRLVNLGLVAKRRDGKRILFYPIHPA